MEIIIGALIGLIVGRALRIICVRLPQKIYDLNDYHLWPFSIEILTALFTAFTTLHFGLQIGLAANFLTWSLITLSAIDLKHQLLPDEITLSFVWLGLGLNYFSLFTDLHSSVLGAMLGYGSLWTVNKVFFLCTKKEGMGYGDFKLLAMLGAWLGWQAIPWIILLSSCLGLGIALVLILLKRLRFSQAIPFGPFLALSGWLLLMLEGKIY